MRSKLLWLGFALCLCTGFYHRYKPLPTGLNAECDSYLVADDQLHFLADLRYEKAGGNADEAVVDQQIFDAIFNQIRGAEKFIVVDYFLVNKFLGQDKTYYRDISQELVDLLVLKKQQLPELPIVFISDEINSVYGGTVSPLFTQLKQAGVTVVTTELTKLRDSNSIYSSLWRVGLQWFGNDSTGGWLPNPFEKGSPKISLRSWLRMVNFKANHRKVLISDAADGVQAIVSSANPHTASSAHSNVALQVTGGPAMDLLNNELAVIAFSDQDFDSAEIKVLAEAANKSVSVVSDANNAVSCQSENKIELQILQWLDQSQSGDSIQLAMFYLSDRDVIEAIKRAAHRGVSVQMVLDPNKDAFGMTKDGVPNRVVAHELVTASENVSIRWYKTHGEQFHSKLFVFTARGAKQQEIHVSLGSANMTKRNIGNFNLETNMTVTAALQSDFAKTITDYFERIWSNPDGVYTLDYGAFGDDSQTKYWRYRVMEATGLSTF